MIETPRDPSSLYPPRATPPSYLVCCHCKREVSRFAVYCEGHLVPVYRCAACGDVVPIQSTVVNRYPNERGEGARR